MSRDIFVQDIPPGIQSTAEIADDWQPRPLPFERQQVIDAVMKLVPSADFSDLSWGRVALPGADIEVNVSDDSPLDAFALHVRASDEAAANNFIADLLQSLGARAFDSESESGIFGGA